MAINFPNSPANGDTHTAAGTTYVYDATNSVWKRQGSSGGFDPASVSESLIPDANETYDLGSSTNKFRDLYLSGNSITLGTVELSDNGGALEVTPTGGGSAEPFATETYVTTQVNNLVDAAPGALDTLNELAAALGDDAAFSTTVTNSLATKADTSSLATVATSGSYNDLSNTPTIPNPVDISGKQDKLVGFNISSASYTAATQVYSQDNTPMGMVVNPAGTTLLMFGWQNDRIYEYSMSTAWDVSTLTYTNRSHDISNDSGFISNLVYNNDGTKLFATDQSSDLIIQMDLGTPYQLNSITATTPQSTNTQLSNSISSPQDVEWYDNGNKAIFVNSSRIYKVDAGAAYTVGGPNLTTPDSNYVDLHNSPPNSGGIIKLGLAQNSSDPSNHSVRGIKFNNDGTELHVLAQVTSSGGETVIYVLDLSTPYDIYTATVDFSKKKIFDLYHSNATSFAFKPDGTKLFMLERGSANGGTTNAVYEYKTGGQLIDIVNSKSDFDGQYSNLTGTPTIPTNNNQLTNGAGYVTSAQLSGDNTVISYSSTSSASTNDVMMLNTDGTVTPVEVTTFPTAVNGSAPVIVPSSTRLAGSTNDGSVVGDAPNHLFKLDGNKYLSVGRHEGGASGFYGVYSAVAEYNSGSWTWGNVYDMNNTNWGTINWNSEYYNDPYVLRSPDNPDKFLFFKLRTGGSFAAIIGTVNGLTISWSDYSQPSQNYPSSTNNSYNVKTEYDYAGSSAGNYKFIVWYGTASDMKAFRVVWDGDTTITWEDEVTISTGNSGTVPNGNINPISASFSRVTEGRLCVHNYTAASLQVYDIDWVNGTTQVGNNFSITASSSTSGTSNYYGVDVKTAWNPLTDEVISINRLASGNPNIRFRRYSVDATRTITANGAEFLPGQSTPFYSSSTFWLNGDFKFFPKSNVVFFSHARKDGSYDLNAIHYLATDNSSSFTEEYGIWTNYGLSGINWPFAARMYPDPFSSGQGSMSYTDRTSGVSRLEGKPLQGEYVESNLDKSKIHGLAATSGTTPDVTTQFGVHSGLSGLTVGSKYYVLDDGTLSTTPDTHNAKIGVAVKSTHIALDFIDELTESDLTTYATKSYVATQTFSGNYNDLTNQPTIPANTSQLANNSGFITAADVPNANTIEYTSTSSASVDDVVMLNTDGTVTPVEVATFPENLSNQGYNGSYQQLLPNSQGYTISNTNGLVAADKGYWLFPTQTDNKYISIAFDEAPGSVFEMKIVSVEYNSSTETWTYGTEYQDLASLGSSLGLDKSDNPYVIGSPDNPDKFLILGPIKNDDLIIHAVGTMAGSGITWSDQGNNLSNGGHTYASRIADINWYYDHAGSTAGSYKVIGAYRDNSSNCRIFRITWDGNTTIQYSDDFAIPHPIDSRSLDFSKLTEGRFAGVDFNGNLRIGDIDWGTGNITVGTAYGLSSFNTNYGTDAPAHVAWRDSSEHFVVAWSVGGGSNSLKLRAFSTTGNSAVAEGSEYSLGYNQGGTYGHLSGNMAFYKNSNMFALTNAGYYYLSNSSNGQDGSFITHFSVNSSFNIVIGTSRVTHGSNYYAKNTGFGYPGKIQMDPFRSGKGSISAAGNTDATSLVVKLFAQPTQGVYVESNLDASKVHGIAASAGTTIDVTVEGGIHTGLSGLTAGSKYYVLSDGSLSTTPDTNNAKVGLAMSTTTLAVDLLDELTSTDLATYATKSYVASQVPSLTGYATETYVDTEIANLVDSSPATLDTLNELAAALGDDANFSTTITNQIAAKADAYSIATVTASGGNFYIDGVQQVTLSFEPGRTYRFDQADSSNSSHPLRFSTTSDGTHGGGSEYTTGVTTNGTAGSAGAYVQIAITNATPTLYYYCVNHGGMGAGTVVGNFSGAYSDLTGAPSIPSAYTDSAVDTHLNQSSATTGQLLSWNGSDYTWTDAASVTNSDTAPSGAAAGDLWFKSDTADLFLYYTDADSSQWVQVGGAGQSTSGSGIQSSIATGNTSVSTTDTGTDGHIDITTEGTARWEVTSAGHILPHANATYDIGSAEKKVRYLFLDSNTMFVGDTSFSEDNIDRSMEVYTDIAAPSSATDIGAKGDVRIVGNYMYVCINTNTWVRTQIETSW